MGDDGLWADVDLRCCDCRDPAFLAAAVGARLVVYDPPWKYDQEFGESAAADHYEPLETEEIARIASSMPGERLAMWLTFPVIQEWFDAARGPGWTWGGARTGGAWSKSGEGDRGHYGQGHHWAGCCEPVLVYGRGKMLVNKSHPDPAERRRLALRNSWNAPPRGHSEKPVDWQRGWLRRWTNPGDLVVDPFCGLGSVAVACVLEGRRYLGAEVVPARHEAARQRVVLARRRPLSAR